MREPTIVPTVAKLLGAGLAHVWPSHGGVHAPRSGDVGGRAEASCSCCSYLLLMLLLHQHHHTLPPHLQVDHLPTALRHHLSVEEAGLQTRHKDGG